ELVSKPNLFSPLYLNARLPVGPFRHNGRFVPVRQMHTAAAALLAAFSEGDFSGFLEYRLGDEKAAAIRAALAAIVTATEAAESTGAKVAFVATVREE
ncbi:MAG: hypothetical protein HY866_03890, partial [Chloroflexi bacterium]|nr:hypothetical protein [Chloroflexota bacterium]